MKITNSQLNQIANLIGTDSQELVIMTAVRTLIENGIDTKTAIEAVCGEGSYNKIANSIYESITA